MKTNDAVEDKAKRPDAKELQEASIKTFQRLASGFFVTWKIYRRSFTGVVGLGIVFGFFLIAVTAQWTAPYDADFKAPAIDTFIADYASRDLPTDVNWSKVIGLTSSIKERPLERVMVYSFEEGQTIVYPVTRGIGELGEIGIEIGSPTTYVLPSGAEYLDYAHFYRSFFFALCPCEDGSNATLMEYNYDFAYLREHEVPFVPLYHSNLWNGFSPLYQEGRLALAFADEHNVWMINKRPPEITEPGIDSVTFTNSLTFPNATIVGNPLVVDGDFTNGSMLLVPTDEGIKAYSLVLTRASLTLRVLDISIDKLEWETNYTIDDEPFEPVTGNNMLKFPYPYSPTTALGKEVVAVGSTDGRLVAFDRVSGNQTWWSKPILPGIREFDILDLYSSPDYIVMVGTTGEKGLIASIDPDTGRIGGNNSYFSTVDSYLNSEPQYVRGQYRYVFSTDMGTIYLATNEMKVNATFSAPGGGAVTPASFLGNIYIEGSRTGNYFGVINAEGALFVETLTGVNIAPLPPGTYPSGNYYPLGTDYEGHDILTQVMFGTRAELLVGVSAAFFSVVIGTIVGLVAGFYPGLVGELLMRATDVMLSLPYLVIMLLFAAAFGPSLFNIIIIFAILSWAGIARVIRSVTLTTRKRAFVDAARVSGASDTRLIFRHIGPNVIPYTFLYMTFMISGAIVTEAILAFLGFGDPNAITWGMMLQFLQISGHSLDAPWWLLPPGIAITLLSLAFYLIGRAFDEVVNPRLRRR
ncbi:MAG: ABC transporter permease [Methanobacteriota archaeon]|nr:MAG: ABC transporter permease [Euryarchaeota archaeon]